MGRIKQGLKTLRVYISAEDAATLERYIKERNQATPSERYKLRDALSMVGIMGLGEMRDRQRHDDRMAAKRTEGHMWCIHTDICGGMLTAPSEEALRAHLQRDHAGLYSVEMTTGEVANHFKPMEER